MRIQNVLVDNLTTTTSAAEYLSQNPYYLGGTNRLTSREKYSRVTTCLALSRAAYAKNAEYCICTLNDLKYMNHGIKEVIYSQHCPHQYLIAFKNCTKEVYVTFRGTDGWDAICSDAFLLPVPNEFQGRFHAGFYQRSKLIPLEPFIDLLNKNENFELIFTGHSLGGAIAATLTARLLFDENATNLRSRIHCVAFGSPLICDDDCSKYINRYYRTQFHFFINQNDVVPILLSTISKLLDDKLSDVMSWFENLIETLKVEIQKEEIRLTPLVRDHTSSSIENIVSEPESSRGFIGFCLDHISLRYAPFGLSFQTVHELSSEDSSSEHITLLGDSAFQKIRNVLYDSNTQKINGNSSLIRYQNHSINNYRIEIYDQVMKLQESTSDSHPPVETELIKEFASASPLRHFFLPTKESWTLYDREKPKSEYEWSVKRDVREKSNEETITLQLKGPAVSLITQVRCELSEYAQHPAKPDETLSQKSVSVFIMKLPLRRNPTVDQYPFLITSHFGNINLKGLFNPKLFVSRTGLEGRKRQVAELVIMDLYKLAFSYSTFTRQTIAEHADESIDAKRCRDVKEYLLSCEKSFQDEFKEIEGLFKDQKSAVVEEVVKELTYVHKERLQSQFAPPRSSEATKTSIENIPSLSTPYKLIRLQDSMTQWQNQNLSDNDSGLATTEVIEKTIPTLVAIVLSMLSPKYDFSIEYGVLAGSIIGVGCFTILSELSKIASLGLGMIVGGAIGGISTYVYQLMQKVEQEYLDLLKRLAQSLGIVMEQIVEHPYCLEKEISSIYAKIFAPYSDNVDYILNHWTNFFLYQPFKDLRKKETRIRHITLVKCIDAHFQMRRLLSEDFAVGVVGSGRTGKSKLIQQMFNFDIKPGKERTKDMRSYRVSDDFRVVDFPHSTSTKDPLRSTYICHHTLVNALVVVLDARKQGDEQGEKDVINTVKSLTNEGVDVLYCFNITDEWIKDQKADNVEGPRVNPFEMTEETLDHAVRIEQPNPQVFRTCWTKERISESLATFAKNYEVDVNQCCMTFFELDVPEVEWKSTCAKLDKLGVKNPSYIKKIWLKKVLESNSVPLKSIEKIMTFWHK